MKRILVGVLAAVLGGSAMAESTVKLTGVHNCCGSCKKGIEAAVTKAGGKAEVAKDAVTITAADDAAAKKAVGGLLAAGYFGSGADATNAASDVKAKSVTIQGPHLCCGKCVDGFNKAAKGAAGVTKTDAKKNSDTVVVEGDVSPKELIEALRKGGFNATVK
ncbi:MAG: cation transporter [Phycisphaerae bacterium]|nr:cation transporter [Tepidisphaeraceae bacterium]